MQTRSILTTMFILLVAGLLTATTLAAPQAQAPAGEAYVVQANDWLSKIADQYYGDPTAFSLIVDATNAKAAEDASFAPIDDPNLIEVGQKLWLPTVDDPATPPATDDDTVSISAFGAALANATYQPSFLDEAVTLQNGVYDNFEMRTVVMLTDFQVRGDLDGDGDEDAAVLISTNTGGSGVFLDLAIMRNDNGTPVNTTSEFLGDRVQVEKFFLEGDQIGLDMITQGPEDPLCCPTLKVTRRYQLQDGVLVNLDGNVTADQLANMAYTLEILGDEAITLNQGEARRAIAPGSASENVVTLVDFTTTGDIDGDGLNDGAAVLAVSTGGSGTFYHLVAVATRNGEPTQIATTMLGDRIQLSSVFINAEGAILVDMLTHGPLDPLCCPTVDTTLRVTFDGNDFIIGNLSNLDDLGGPIPTEPLTSFLLRNATYQGIYDEPVTLEAGRYEGEPFVPGGVSRPSVTFIDELQAFGDLNGDGRDDAAVLLVENSGGSGVFVYLAAVLDEQGFPNNVATTLLGDRSQVLGLNIENGQIVVEYLTQGPDDPFCCPSLLMRDVLSLSDATLSTESSTELGTLSREYLQGTVWQLVSMGPLSDPTPVLPDSRITLEFGEDQIAGNGGCNGYFAGYGQAEGYNALAFEGPGSTQMFCVDVMDQEMMYFEALQSVSSFQFNYGQLLLIYDGGILRFEPQTATPLPLP